MRGYRKSKIYIKRRGDDDDDVSSNRLARILVKKIVKDFRSNSNLYGEKRDIITILSSDNQQQ